MDPTAAEREDPYKVSEDAILDGLFYACDTENLGQVSASRLIEYLRNAISNGTEEFAGNLDDLSLILDPEGKDMEIGLTSFQEGIKEWISDIRRRSFVSVEDNFHSPVAVNCMESPQSTYSGHKRSPVTSTPNVSSDSVEGLGGVTPEKDWDRAGELIGTIEDLQLNNKRLMEQQNAIEAQMENTEEANNQLSVEIESLQKQLRSCQLIIEKGKEKDKDNSELRQAVTEALEANKRLHTKISQLEKERALFEGNINEVHEKLLESQTELELLEGERRRLVQELAEQKQYCSDLHEIQGVKDDMIAKESSTKSTVIADLSSANDSLKREKSRLQSVVSELEANLLRAKRSELSEENRQLHHNGPILSSTPFARQSSLQQELQAQESFATKGLPSPMVGNQRNLDDSLDVDSINHSLLSTASLDSVNTTATFEKYSISATQLASEFNEKREKALRQIDELALFDQSPEMKDKREMLREQLTEDMDTFADKISSLCVKKKAAERRASKLLVTIKKLKEENKQLFEERGKAFQKLGTMSISNDEVNSRLSDLEGKLEQERRIVAEKDEKLKFLEQQLSATSQELLILREENESLSTSLESQRQLSSRLKDELSMLRKLQDEMEGLQTLSLVRIKELESELLKVKVDLNVEKRRSSTLEESIQLSVLKHSDELKDIFDTIPSTDAEVLNRSRQSPRTSSPGVTGHMVRTRLCDYITQADTARRMQGVGRRDSPDGKPFSDHELEDSLHPSYERIAKGQKLQQLNETPSEGWLDPSYERITKGQQQQEVNETPSEGWLDNEFYKLPSSSISSDSLSPTTSERSPPVVNERQDRQQIVDSLESPSGKLLHGTENIDTEKQQIVDSLESPSKENVQHVDTEKLTSSSQTELFNKLVSTGSQTDLVTEVCVADKATITEEDSQAESKDRRRKSGASAPPAVADKKGETASARDGAKESDSSSKLAVGVDKEKPATSLWRKKLSVAFKIPEEFDAYESATSMALESSVESKYFVDGVSLRVRPAPNEKEIEKQFRTLVLAFQTDQDTLNRRLEVQAHGRDVAESNMIKELQRTSDLLKGFEALCITKDMQEMLLMLKSQVELLRKSSKRVSSQTEQHGCVQQEARMSSGVEVMICHAENLSRHLERMREDLHELRLRERLTDVEPTGSDERLANGPTNLDSHQDGIVPSSVLASSQSETGTDSTRQNSLFNFVMAFHTTSMRAKDALRKFRLRTEASRQERAASESYKPETDEAEVVARESHNEESLEGRDTSNPVVLVDEPEEDKVEESETVIEEEGKEEESDHVQEHDLEEVEEPCPEEDGNEELSLEESMPPELPKRPSVCRRCTLAVFRFTILIIVFSAVVFIGTVVQYKDSHFTINPQYAMSKFYEYLQPFGQLIYYFEPPS